MVSSESNGFSVEGGDNTFSSSPNDIQKYENTCGIANSLFELGLHKRLREAKDPADLKTRINDLVKYMGFSDYTYTIPETAIETDVQFLTTPRELRDAYKAGGYFEYDMVTNYGRTQTNPIFDSQIEEYVARAPFDNDIIRLNREMFRMLKSFGYHDFYIIPIRSPGTGRNVMLSVQIKDQSPATLWETVSKHKITLQQLVECITDVLWTRFPDYFFNSDSTRDIRIGRKSLQLLTVLARDDLTLNQAADKLCISIHTANQHMAAARGALAVCTTTGAVFAAMKHGLISAKTSYV